MLNKLEKKFGRFAIKGLMKYVVILYAAGFAVSLIDPIFYNKWLMLDIDKVIFHGQVWRLVTFLIQPIDSSNIVFMLIMLLCYYSIGTSLEMAWGSFKFNLYYFGGVFFNELAVILIYIASYIVLGYGISWPISLEYLNLSLFMAFGLTFPEARFLLMFLIPVKAKWMSIVYIVFIGIDVAYAFMSGILTGIVTLVFVTVSLMNFVIFFIQLKKKGFSPSQARRRREYQKATAEYGNGKVADIVNIRTTKHKCAICGKTENDDPDLVFRFCSKCNGNYEYCSEHIFTHEHKE